MTRKTPKKKNLLRNKTRVANTREIVGGQLKKRETEERLGS